ncbi:hypothetical protein GXW82_35585 [Streptacidiphilus sp. 4-A2]|nr:hypothetical protein [Streptacidiphilus sp. 4-A2]
MKQMLKCKPADFAAEALNALLLLNGQPVKHTGPTDYDNPLPDFRGKGVRQVVALTNRQVTQAAFALLALAYVGRAVTVEVDAVQHRTSHSTMRGVGIGKKISDTCSQSEPAILPPLQSLSIRR